MPIKGISEIVRLPRLGKIHLGIKEISKKTGQPYPTATDYFVCPDEVKQIFGDKPKALKIMFPLEDDSKWASQWLKCYSSSRGLICRGDGETAMARVDKKTGEIASKEAIDTELKEITCDPEKCKMYAIKHCRRIMNLQFLLPDCPGLGVYQIDTSSFHSIVNINSNIDLIRGICGRISMIPLTLKMIEQEVSPEGKKKKVHVLNISVAYSLAEMQKFGQLPPAKVLLPAPETEAPEDLFPDEILEGNGEKFPDTPELKRAREALRKEIMEENELPKGFTVEIKPPESFKEGVEVERTIENTDAHTQGAPFFMLEGVEVEKVIDNATKPSTTPGKGKGSIEKSTKAQWDKIFDLWKIKGIEARTAGNYIRVNFQVDGKTPRELVQSLTQDQVDTYIKQLEGLPNAHLV